MKSVFTVVAALVSLSLFCSTASAAVYDDFSGATLNLSKWFETTTVSFPDEHMVNTTEQAYHIAQHSVEGDRDVHLTMSKGVTDETIEYDLIYVSGSGNHLHNIHFAPYGYPWYTVGLNYYIGYWNYPGEWGSQQGLYHIKVDFDSGLKKADISIRRPDGTYWTGVADLSFTSPPYHLLMQTSAGHNGVMHFDYDNFVITMPEVPAAPELPSILSAAMVIAVSMGCAFLLARVVNKR